MSGRDEVRYNNFPTNDRYKEESTISSPDSSLSNNLICGAMATNKVMKLSLFEKMVVYVSVISRERISEI